MTAIDPVAEEELHAYIDGELPPGRARAVAAALESDPVLAARVAAFKADKAALAMAFGPIARQAVPAAWIARIEQAAAQPVHRDARRRVLWAVALAACVVLVLGRAAQLDRGLPDGSILAQAEAAQQGRTPAVTRLTGAALADAASRDATLADAVGLKLRAPDLARMGWRLDEIDIYAKAAALRYSTVSGGTLTLFVRPSAGAPWFDLRKSGSIRECIWQDEVVGAVMMGDMSAGQMMRVAGAAYAALNL
jgi:anti-sigma factor RsiW